MDSTDFENRFVAVVIVIVAVLTFLYAVVIRHTLLTWVFLMFVLGFLYLALRFIRAIERIAAALEE